MELKELITCDLCFAKVEACDRENLLRGLSEHLFKHGIVTQGFADSIVKREREYPTGLPLERELNVAIPHTFSEYVVTPRILVATLAKPMDFQCMGDPETIVSVGTVMVMMVKEGQLEALKQLMALVSGKPETMDALQKADSNQEIFDLLMSSLA